MNISISVEADFAAGHRILGLTGEGAKCSTPHGHNFRAVWEFDSPDAFPPAVEFGSVKRVLKELVASRFDHAFFCDNDDPFMDWLVANNCKVFPMDGPPTTERMVYQIAELTKGLLSDAVLRSVRLHEGPVNTAICTF